MLTDVSSYTERSAADTDHGSLTARAAATRPVLVSGVEGPADDIVDRLADHQGLGNASLDVEDGTGLAQERRQNRLFGIILAQPADIRHAVLDALDSLDCILTTPSHPAYLDPQLIL